MSGNVPGVNNRPGEKSRKVQVFLVVWFINNISRLVIPANTARQKVLA